MDNFKERSYRRHAAEFNAHATGGALEDLTRSWLSEDTVDAWRHERMYSMLDPLLGSDPQAHWVTVGDGRFGKDAIRLRKGGARVMATDIAGGLLAEAHRQGLLEAFSAENAEKLSFPDESFDYAYCKEAYHHFPRPLIALHEMLRVVKKAVVLTEPLDRHIPPRIGPWIVRRLVELARRLAGRRDKLGEYEPSGNYIYRLSVRELQKVALGMDYPAIAYFGFNDSYVVGVENEKLASRGALFRSVRLRILLKDMLCRIGIMEYGLLTAVIFKQAPSQATIGALRERGYTFQDLPRNPYAGDRGSAAK